MTLIPSFAFDLSVRYTSIYALFGIFRYPATKLWSVGWPSDAVVETRIITYNIILYKRQSYTYMYIYNNIYDGLPVHNRIALRAQQPEQHYKNPPKVYENEYLYIYFLMKSSSSGRDPNAYNDHVRPEMVRLLSSCSQSAWQFFRTAIPLPTHFNIYIYIIYIAFITHTRWYDIIFEYYSV